MKTTMIRTAMSAVLMAAAMITPAEGAVSQQSAKARGRAIAEEADRRDYGWGDNSTTDAYGATQSERRRERA